MLGLMAGPTVCATQPCFTFRSYGVEPFDAGGRTPNAMHAYDQLVQALRDQQQWEQRAKTAKDLLNEMLASRKEADRLREQGYDIR